MNYKGHLTGGIVTTTIVVVVTLIIDGLDWITSAVCGVSTLVFSLYPDLDIASKPSRFAFILGILAILYLIYAGYYLEAILTFLFISVPKAFPHRGLVHSLKFGLIATVCWIFILIPFVDVDSYYIMGAGMVGYMTHLISDSHVRV